LVFRNVDDVVNTVLLSIETNRMKGRVHKVAYICALKRKRHGKA